MQSRILDPAVLKAFLATYRKEKTADSNTLFKKSLGLLADSMFSVVGRPTGQEHMELCNLYEKRFEKIRSATANEIVTLCRDLGEDANAIFSYDKTSRCAEMLQGIRCYILTKIPHLAATLKQLDENPNEVLQANRSYIFSILSKMPHLTSTLEELAKKPENPSAMIALIDQNITNNEDSIVPRMVFEVIYIKERIKKLSDISADLSEFKLSPDVNEGITQEINRFKRNLAYLGYDWFKNKSDQIKAAFPENTYLYPDKQTITNLSSYPCILQPSYLTMFLKKHNPNLRADDVIQQFEKVAAITSHGNSSSSEIKDSILTTYSATPTAESKDASDITLSTSADLMNRFHVNANSPAPKEDSANNEQIKLVSPKKDQATVEKDEKIATLPLLATKHSSPLQHKKHPSTDDYKNESPTEIISHPRRRGAR